MSESKPKLTPWFPAKEKPAREGVYERLTSYGSTTFSRWNGRFWCKNSTDMNHADQVTGKSAFQRFKWRGLTRPAT